MGKRINVNLFLFTIFWLTLFSSCISVKYLPNSKEIAKTHYRIAILSPIIEISSYKGKDSEKLKRRFDNGTIDYQGVIFEQLKRKLKKKKINIETLLFYDYDSLLKKQVFEEGFLDHSAFCKLYEVDGVLQSEFYINKQLSDGAALLSNIVDLSLSEKEISLRMILYDKTEGDIYHYWYTHEVNSNESYNSSRAIKDQVRGAIKYLPYFREPTWAKEIKKDL